MWVHALVDADARCGGKAVGLARLISAGLPVPPGFVIDTQAFQHVVGDLVLDDPTTMGHVIATTLDRIAQVPLPADVVREIEARTDALAAPNGYAVRSSATIEDRNSGAAAGVFSSRGSVVRADLWDAIRAVWISALTPLAVTYARRRGGVIAIGVIVQPFVSGEPSTIYTRPPGSPGMNQVLVQRDTSIVRLPREATEPEVVLALRAEAAIGATTGADIELVGDVVVQARPIVHPARRASRSIAPPTVTSLLLADGRRWTWDIAHNPDPLSTAQSELVERVEQAGIAPYSLRVCAGYLYSTSRESVTAPSLDKLGDIEARLGELVDTGDGITLDESIDRYLKFYAIWSRELSPLVAAAKPSTPTRRPSSVESLLLGAARGEIDEAAVLARLGVLSPSWDVAVPTYAERPEVLRDALARAKELVRYGSRTTGEMRALDPRTVAPPTTQVATLADLAERDDYWFARAQWMVRRALLHHGRGLGLDEGDVFWVPFTAIANGISADDARRRTAGARAAAARATRWEMPIVVGEDRADADAPGDTVRAHTPSGSHSTEVRTRTPSGSHSTEAVRARTPSNPQSTDAVRVRTPSGPHEPSSGSNPAIAVRPLASESRGGQVLRGTGSGGRVNGRVVRFATLASTVSVGRGDVVVARAITPALAVMVIGCAALVSETGGFLDHGAAMARELGIPCVVGCKDAWLALDDGMVVTVDGDAGTVTISIG